MPRGVGRGGGVPNPNIDLESMDSKHLSGKAKPGTKIEAAMSRSGMMYLSKLEPTVNLIQQQKGETVDSIFASTSLKRPCLCATTVMMLEPRGPLDMGDAMDVDLEYIAPTAEHTGADEATIDMAHLEGPLYVKGVSVDDV